MDLEIRNKWVHMHMKDYLLDCIEDFPEEIPSAAKTLATKSLMRECKESDSIDRYKSEIFHSVVKKLLHVAKRSRLDLQISLGFICTRVRSPNKGDWKKLKRILQYIYGTIDLERILLLDSFTNMNKFIDAFHACHDNKRG